MHPENIERVEVRLPSDSATIVNSREIPSINVQYLVAGTLLDDRFTTAMTHDGDRMADLDIVAMRSKVQLVRDRELRGTRNARVTVTFNGESGGRTVTRYVKEVRGTSRNPMSVDEGQAKAQELMVPRLGRTRVDAIIAAIRDPDTNQTGRELGQLLRVG